MSQVTKTMNHWIWHIFQEVKNLVLVQNYYVLYLSFVLNIKPI